MFASVADVHQPGEAVVVLDNGEVAENGPNVDRSDVDGVSQGSVAEDAESRLLCEKIQELDGLGVGGESGTKAFQRSHAASIHQGMATGMPYRLWFVYGFS